MDPWKRRFSGVYITAAFSVHFPQDFELSGSSWHKNLASCAKPEPLAKSTQQIQNHPKSSISSEIIQIQWPSSQSLSISQIWDGHVHDEASSANLRTAMSWIYQRLQVYCLQALSWSNWGKVKLSYVICRHIRKISKTWSCLKPKTKLPTTLEPQPEEFSWPHFK